MQVLRACTQNSALFYINDKKINKTFKASEAFPSIHRHTGAPWGLRWLFMSEPRVGQKRGPRSCRMRSFRCWSLHCALREPPPSHNVSLPSAGGRGFQGSHSPESTSAIRGWARVQRLRWEWEGLQGEAIGRATGEGGHSWRGCSWR